MNLKNSNEVDFKAKAKESYNFIRLLYRRLAAQTVVGEAYNVGWNTLRDFLIN